MSTSASVAGPGGREPPNTPAGMRPILIAGPTAAGKSALALRIAERIGGMIVNADSMQVYGELSILTARPPPEDLARAPHRLYGHVPAAEAYSAGRFVREVAVVLEEARRLRLRPIIVGGTGLYFKALADGLAPIPDIPTDVRRHWRDEALRVGAIRLHAILAARDHEMASRLAAADIQRVTRALEVLDATGLSLARWQEMRAAPLIPEDGAARLLVMPARDDLQRRAARRFDAMLAAGALDEARRFLALGIDDERPATRALGLPQLCAHLRGEITLDAAVAAAKLETRQYIKRQQTWMKRHMMSWTPCHAQQTESNDDFDYSLIDR